MQLPSCGILKCRLKKSRFLMNHSRWSDSWPRYTNTHQHYSQKTSPTFLPPSDSRSHAEAVGFVSTVLMPSVETDHWQTAFSSNPSSTPFPPQKTPPGNSRLHSIISPKKNRDQSSLTSPNHFPYLQLVHRAAHFQRLSQYVTPVLTEKLHCFSG